MRSALTVFALLAGNTLAQQQVLSHAVSPEELPRDPALNMGIKVLVQRLMRQAHIPGLSVGVVHSDNFVETASWGIRSEQGDRTTSDTLFNIASCSKAFLSATMGILMDDFSQGHNQTALPPGVRKFHWETKVKDLLPGDWKLMDEWTSEKAAVRDILSHQTGMPKHEYSFTATDRPLDVIRRMRHLRPAFELRQREHYNNQMYMLASHIIATYSGMPYPEYIQQRIFDPLNMTSTTFSPRKARQAGKLSEAWTSFGRLIPFWFSDETLDLHSGPGGIISNVEDMTKWIQTVLGEGVDPMTNTTIIPRSALQETMSAQTVFVGRARQPYFSVEGYAMGWACKSYQGHEIVDHNGGIPGFSSQVVLLPSDKMGIVMLANGDAKHLQQMSIFYRIIEDYLKLQRKESERLLLLSATSGQASRRITSTSDSGPQSPLELSLAEYAGTYRNLGYGAFTLCAPSPTPTPECTAILDALSPFYSVYNTSTPELYTTSRSTYVSYLRFVHRDANTFDVHGTFLFPNGYGKDKTPFETEDIVETAATGEFWVDGGRVKGFALNGYVGETTDRQRRGGSIADTAEIWFEKL